jgi:hypothetical protein
MTKANNMTNEAFVSMVATIVAQHGCKIVDVDFNTKTLNLDGPEDAVADCARALAEMLE